MPLLIGPQLVCWCLGVLIADATADWGGGVTGDGWLMGRVTQLGGPGEDPAPPRIDGRCRP